MWIRMICCDILERYPTSLEKARGTHLQFLRLFRSIKILNGGCFVCFRKSKGQNVNSKTLGVKVQFPPSLKSQKPLSLSSFFPTFFPISFLLSFFFPLSFLSSSNIIHEFPRYTISLIPSFSEQLLNSDQPLFSSVSIIKSRSESQLLPVPWQFSMNFAPISSCQSIFSGSRLSYIARRDLVAWWWCSCSISGSGIIRYTAHRPARRMARHGFPTIPT